SVSAVGVCGAETGDDTIRLFKRFNQAAVYRFYSVLRRWQRSESWILDLDSLVLERYGQQRARRGHNPKTHGRTNHHPLLAAFFRGALCVCTIGCAVATA